MARGSQNTLKIKSRFDELSPFSLCVVTSPFCLLFGIVPQARNQLAVVRGSEYTLIKSRFDELYARQARVLSTMGGVVWREKLEEAVSAADSASSALAADFMAGDVALEEFVQQHLELRMQHHVLDLKRQAAEALLAGMAGSGGGAGGSGGGA